MSTLRLAFSVSTDVPNMAAILRPFQLFTVSLASIRATPLAMLSLSIKRPPWRCSLVLSVNHHKRGHDPRGRLTKQRLPLPSRMWALFKTHGGQTRAREITHVARDDAQGKTGLRKDLMYTSTLIAATHTTR